MASHSARYVLVGGGLASATAAENIRKHDGDGSILIIGSEVHPPYHRPPLSSPRRWVNILREGTP